MFVRGHKNIFRVNKKVEKNKQLQILPAQSDEDFETVRKLLVEYAGSLGFHLRFQNFDEELANLPGDYVSPTGCLLLAVLKELSVGCVALRKLSDDRKSWIQQQKSGLPEQGHIAKSARTSTESAAFHRHFVVAH